MDLLNVLTVFEDLAVLKAQAAGGISYGKQGGFLMGKAVQQWN